MIEQILLMCAIVGLSPVEVDCNTQWLLIQDDQIMVATGDKGVAVYNFTKFPVSNYYPELVEYDNLRWIAVADLVRDNCWNDVMTDKPTGCLPLIWHELKHQICTCNWHENLVQTFKSFKGAFGGL